MSIKENNKRLTITFNQVQLDKLKIIMFDLKTRQPSKAIGLLIENYKKD